MYRLHTSEPSNRGKTVRLMSVGLEDIGMVDMGVADMGVADMGVVDIGVVGLGSLHSLLGTDKVATKRRCLKKTT